MKFTIVGLGSIGKKHFNNLKNLGYEVTAVSRSQKGVAFYEELGECLISQTPDVVWVCNETSLHSKTLEERKSSGFKGIVLCEKPLFHENLPFDHQFKNLFITYQLRLHPLVQKLKNEISKEEILTSLFYVGQFLPQWRPSQDYRNSYSAKISGGGGVLRDLSHELDLSLYLSGKMERLVCEKRKVSDLEIETEDICLIQGTSKKSVFQFQMNYLDKKVRRFIIINTQDSTYELDFISGWLKRNGEVISTFSHSFSPYQEIISSLSSQSTTLCTLEDALYLQKVIDYSERSASLKGWVYL